MAKNHAQPTAIRQAPDQPVATYLAGLREERDRLNSEISRLMVAGAEMVERATVVGRDRHGKPITKVRRQPRGLTAGEREAIGATQRKIADINATLRAFGTR